jgi:hypothetical protein
MNEITSLNFTVAAVVPGSINEGQSAALADLKSTTFAIEFIDSATAEACASNILNPQQTTVAGTIRDDILIYDIPKAGESVDPFVIEGKAVTGLLTDCKLKTKVQVYDDYACAYSTDAACDSWVEFADTLATIDYDTMAITWPLDQQHWYDALEWKYADFASGTIDYHPTVVEFRLRF